ncbi:3'-5' exonuclease domain-containing protein [Rozella allomycis CSF55]|uniref:3'-5' exonuclease domain-containing protein n=1 Tax=Rozella allomycis (strain CSF55) TaxID=988480 RepID=A0A075AY39_ROZAC|nr:3'-5' exonuclease domain-containing protein [Rozella allomycis CSF55]|eukprot:EPZ35172.1 3'-5' exonuclease domain-containing protein [Rozella allomycis CSF55]
MEENFVKHTISLVKQSNQLYTKHVDLPFHLATSPAIGERLEKSAQKILSIGRKLIALESQFLDLPEYLNVENVEHVVDSYDRVIEVTDHILERIDATIEVEKIKASGKDMTPVNAKQSSAVSISVQNGNKSTKFIHAQNISRPQLRFKDQIDNSMTPFIPKLKNKPHALVPLPNYSNNENVSAEIPDHLQSHIQSLGVGNGFVKQHGHPYEYEIRNLNLPEHAIQECVPEIYKSLEETPLLMVNTEEQLLALIKDLEGESVIAIDLENHSYRSYQGFVCLMQISSRQKDFIVDTLELRHFLHQLNVVFANPNIVKVLHGADSDIIWLQRDFGLYIVNMFDTYFASKELSCPSHSLAYLLSHYAGIKVDKKYQLADWRIRPLPEEMVKYAREDTHYLLYIYDNMKNELIEKRKSETEYDPLHKVLSKSNDLTLKRYEKEIYSDVSWFNLYKKYNRNLEPRLLKVFQALHRWRDQLAREQDESTHYVLPNHMLFRIAERAPKNVPQILGCCNPVPPLVRLHANDLSLLISRVLDEYETKKNDQIEQFQNLETMAESNHTIFESNSEISETEVAEQVIDEENLKERIEDVANVQQVVKNEAGGDSNSKVKMLNSSVKSQFLAVLEKIEVPISLPNEIMDSFKNVLEPWNEFMDEIADDDNNFTAQPPKEEAVPVKEEIPVDSVVTLNDLKKGTSSKSLDSILSEFAKKQAAVVDQDIEEESPAQEDKVDYSILKQNLDTGNKSKKRKIFNPFKEKSEVAFKQKKRLSTKPNSGNKSFTFKNK